MDEGAEGESPAADNAETTTIPASIIGGQTVKPGDVIRLSVVSSDGDNIVVEYDHPAEEKGSDGMAAEYDQPQPA